MNFWINFWSFFFFLSLAIFAVLTITVTIGGFLDIRSLFKSLKAQHEKQGSEAKDSRSQV
jgi:hypothetical protein